MPRQRQAAYRNVDTEPSQIGEKCGQTDNSLPERTISGNPKIASKRAHAGILTFEPENQRFARLPGGADRIRTLGSA
jgi:hypothetical protein